MIVALSPKLSSVPIQTLKASPSSATIPLMTSIKYRNLPTVVLAGRPNVGKSTLFNRLLHKRRAITDPTPGVTRDPVEMDCLIDDKPLKLIDTGGFKLTDCEGIDKLVVKKTLDRYWIFPSNAAFRFLSDQKQISWL